MFLLWEVCFGVSGGVSTGGCLNIFLGWVLVCVQSLFTWLWTLSKLTVVSFGFVFLLGLGLKDSCVGSVAEVDNCVSCV